MKTEVTISVNTWVTDLVENFDEVDTTLGEELEILTTKSS